MSGPESQMLDWFKEGDLPEPPLTPQLQEKLLAISALLANSSNWTWTTPWGTGPDMDLDEIDPGLPNRYITNRRMEGYIFYVFILLYSLLILFGALGNILVISAVARKKTMRTARNMFIINLAISDLLLCGLTMPLTLLEILTMHWPLGENHFVCKIFGSLQAISIFVSTISITAIALDRYHVIVYPTKPSVQRCGAITALGVIWVVSCVLAAPLFIWRRLDTHEVIGYGPMGLNQISFCFEAFPIDNGRAFYSIFTILVQYLLPILVVSLSYARICNKLRHRMRPGGVGRASMGPGASEVPPSGGQEGQGRKRLHRESTVVIENSKNRVQRTNTLLIAIALIFGISWLPLNLFNVIVDLWDPLNSDKDTYMYIYAICHMIGMTSATINPVLYGWLNENFRKEFREILSGISSSCRCSCPPQRGVLNGVLKPGNCIRNTLTTVDEQPDPEEIVVQYNKKRSHVQMSNNGGGGDGVMGGGGVEEDGEVEQSVLITQVLEQHK